tara:strand:+ start:8947 stop:10446 length:1500 start_codon:yes stop_codon:yes gene_type:complete
MKNAKNIIEPDFQHDESGVEANEKVIITKPFVSQIIEFYKAKNKVCPIIKDKTVFNSPCKYTKFFYYKGKLWKITKRTKADAAVWWFRGKIDGKSYWRATKSPNYKHAVNYIILNWVGQKDAAARDAAKQKHEKLSSTIYEMFKAYEAVKKKDKPDSEWDKQARNKQRQVERVCEVLFPGKSFASLTVDQVLNENTIKRYQNAFVSARKKAAKKKYGDDVQEIEKAEANAWAASFTTIRNVKSFFGDKHGSIVSELKKAGLVLPESFEVFKSKKAQGGRASWDVYERPSDDLIKRTFEEIEQFAIDEPIITPGTHYIKSGLIIERKRPRAWSRRAGSEWHEGRKYHVYQMFWSAVGAGMRSNEIITAKKSQFQTIDGALTVTGIGKVKTKLIDIPLQPAAAARLPVWMKKDTSRYLLGDNLNYRRETVPKLLRAWMRSIGWETRNLLHMLRAYIGYRIYFEVGPTQAQQYLRHEKLEITEKFYAARFATRQAAVINLEF